jgi:hypothetical protein
MTNRDIWFHTMIGTIITVSLITSLALVFIAAVE